MRKNCSKLSVILFSILVIFTFTGCPGGTSFFSLEAPQNLSVDNIYSDMIELSWDSQSSISGYVLYISLDDSFSNQVQALDVQQNNAVSITGFQSSTTYYFRVTAYKNSSESDPSEMVSATTLVGAPQGVKISFSNDNNDITLSWDAVPRATGYEYYYGLSSDMANNDFGEILNKNSGSISVTIKDGASSKGLYHVWVLGKDDNSVSSNYAYGIKRKGSPNYKFYKEAGPSSKEFSYSLDEVSDDTEVFLIKVNSDEYSVGKDDTGGVTKVNNNFVDNSEKFYAKYSILGKPISRSSEINPTFSDDTTVVRLDHLPSKKNLFDINNMKSVTSRSGSVVQSRSYSDFKEYSIGTTKKFWIDDANGNFSQKTATLRAEGTYSYVWVVNDTYSSNSTLKNDNKITDVQAEYVAQKFDYIYGPETTVFGETYKSFYESSDFEDAGLVPPEEKISILICDIFGDYSSNQSGGILGYFWNKDFFNDDVTKSQGIRSNEAEIFYIDSHFLDAFTDMTYSTLAHEFQHMLNYVNKDIKHRKTPTVWYNEMLSMVCEDLLQDFIGIEDKDSPRGRLPQFNYGYAFNGAEEWFNDANTLNSYAHAYAFGAFITRNYGGASLVKYIMENEYVDLDSIIEAIRDITGNYNYYKEDLLFEFARALCYPEGFEGSEDDPSTPLGKAKAKGIKHFYRENSSQIGGYTYNLKPICLFDYSFKYADENGNVKTNFGPFYFGVGNILDLRPYGISIHSFGVKSGKFTFGYIPPSHAYVDDYFVIQ